VNKTNNYRPVIGSLLPKLPKAGFTLVSVDSGCGQVPLTGTDREKRQEAKFEICAVDEAHLYVENSESISKWLYIVIGNEPEETVCDYTCDSGLDEVVEEFQQQWKGKKCPTK
jgi:hypothetical protein